MSAPQFYPALNKLVSTDNLPELIKSTVDTVSNKLFYKTYYVEKSIYGEAAYHHIVLIFNTDIGLNLIGGENGFRLLFNHGSTSGTTEIPIAIYYNLPILKYVRQIHLDQLNSLQDYFGLLIEMFEISREELFFDALDVFFNSYENPVEEFVDQFNQNPDYSSYPPLTYPATNDYYTGIVGLMEQLADRNIDSNLYILSNYINNSEDLSILFNRWLGEFNLEAIVNLFIPKISASIQALNLALVFPRTWLKPVNAQGDVIEDDSVKSMLTYQVGSISYDSEYGFEFINPDSFDLTPSQIGNTGLLLNIDNLKFDFRTDRNIPEADADGRPNEFQGIYADLVSVTLPKKWFNTIDNTTLQIVGRNLLVGTGGVSGTIALETVGGQPNNGAAYMGLKIGNWKIGFNYFNMTFKQNVIQESNVAGRLTIPKLKKPDNTEAVIDIVGHLNEAGDFNLTASTPGGVEFTLFNFVTFNFLTLELGRENDTFYIGTSCQIWFENQVMSELIGNQKIEIPRLRVYDNGTIEIVGGNGFLPLNISLNLGPIEMAVTGVHYGSTQLEYNGNMRKYNYWGFDGAISIDPLGIDVRGDGIKYYYTTDNDEHGDAGDSFIHINTLEIDLVIPGTASPQAAIAIINGMVSIPSPGESEEYVGQVGLKLPKAKIAGGASMRLQPRQSAFLVDAFIDLPAPIPIGPLGVYGFRGLLGFKYVAEREAVGLNAEDSWYDYYTYPPRGIHHSKFSGPERTSDYNSPFSLGAGAVLGTSFDNGMVLSVRAMLLLSLPSMFMVDGRASILSSQLGLDDSGEPPFFATAIWSSDSIEVGMGADFKLPSSSGMILSIQAEVQSGFFFNSPLAWYLNLGTKDNPISAEVLTLFTAQSYLMLSAQGIEAGARVHYELRKRFGPARVALEAYLEKGGFISFERSQIGGYIAAGGKIDVKIWKIGVSLTLSTIFSAEAAKPFLIYAEVEVRACIKIVFKRICKSFTVKIKWEKDSSIDRSAIPPLPQGKVNEMVKGVHMLTNESFDLSFSNNIPSVSSINNVIPLDTFVEIKTEKSLIPSSDLDSIIGGYTFPPENHTDLIPPKKVVRGGLELRQVKHQYSIEKIEIKAWDGNKWVDYHPFKAAVDESKREDVAHLRIGYWQLKDKQYNTIRLLATSPFTYMQAGEPGWHTPEIYGLTASTLYCEQNHKKEGCANVLNKALGKKYYPLSPLVGNYINGAYFSLSNISGFEIIGGNIVPVDNEYMQVTDSSNTHNFEKSLSFSNNNILTIVLPESSVRVTLKLNTYAQGVNIKYYAPLINDETSIVQYELIQQDYKTSTQLNHQVVFENEDRPVSKIVIEPDNANMLAIQQTKEQIALLFANTYQDSSGLVSISEPKDRKRYDQLIQTLAELNSSGCSQIKEDCKPDETLCSLYQQLQELFDVCFVFPIDEKEIELLQERLDCFNKFHELIINFDRKHPQYHIIELMDEIYFRFKDFLYALIELLANYPNHTDPREIIQVYIRFREQSLEVLNFISNEGDCNCDDESKTKCTTSFQQVCWLSLENHQWNQNIPGAEAIQEDYESMTEAIEDVIQPIWRPNTSYYIKLKLKDEVDNGSNNTEFFDYYYGFKTVGPLGHYHKNPESNYINSESNADEYPLASLGSYIDYRRSFPDAKGNLLKAKPVFYDNEQCKISIFFNQDFTEQMFKTWEEYLNLPKLEGQLHIAIKDPVTDVIIPYPLPVDYNEETVPLPVFNPETNTAYNWEIDDYPQLPIQIQLINNLIENSLLPCEMDLGSPIKPRSTFFSVVLTNLKPQKLYTALLYNAFEESEGNIVNEKVHEFVFQTSRYQDFEEQVKSYSIKDENGEFGKQAVYQIDISLSSDSVTKALDIVSNPGNQNEETLNNYQHLFDRVIEGVFEMPPLDPAVRTEFYKIFNLNSGNVIGILIKNPEPFNSPKTPLNEAKKMISLRKADGSEDTAYKILYSNDYSQAIIMHNSAQIPSTNLDFKFQYLQWNGNHYNVEEIINITINQ